MEIHELGKTSRSFAPGSELETKETKGKNLFQGHSIEFFKEGRTIMESLKEFLKFFSDPRYRQQVRYKFFENAKSEIETASKRKVESDELERMDEAEEIADIAQTIRTIMKTSNIDMPEGKKMELILFTIEHSSPKVKEYFKSQNSMLPQDARDNYKKATQYFENKMSKMNDEIIRLVYPHLIPSGSANERPTTSSEEQLNFLKMESSKRVIDSLYYYGIDNNFVKEFVQKLVENAELNLSEKETNELWMYTYIKYNEKESIDDLVKKTMSVIDDMAMATATQRDKKKILTNLNEIKKEFQGGTLNTVGKFRKFQESYAKVVIKKMVEMYPKNQALDVLKQNFNELLEFEPLMMLTKNQKDSLISSIKPIAPSEPLDEDEINEILSEVENAIKNQLAGGTSTADRKIVDTKFEKLEPIKKQIKSQEDIDNYIYNLVVTAIDSVADEGDPSTLIKDVTDLLLSHESITISDEKKSVLIDRAKIGKMRRDTMNLIKYVEEKVIGPHAAVFLIDDCGRIQKEGNLIEIEKRFKEIQLRCISICVGSRSFSEDNILALKNRPTALAELRSMAEAILQRATLLSAEEKKPLGGLFPPLIRYNS